MGHVRAYESVELVSSCMGHEASQDQQNIIGYSRGIRKWDGGRGREGWGSIKALENRKKEKLA